MNASSRQNLSNKLARHAGRAPTPTPAGISSPTGRIQPAYTLIEMLFVMVIIAIMVGIAIPISRFAVGRARAAKEDIERTKIVMALEDYRAKYGEYPIVGDPRHYATDYMPTTDTNGYEPITTNDLTSRIHNEVDYGEKGRGMEVMEIHPLFAIVYRLTYPLYLAPLARGETPFVPFPKIKIAYLVYKQPTDSLYEQHVYYTLKTKYGEIPIDYWLLQGLPIYRVKAVSPVTRQQWWYECSDGLTYILTNINPWAK